MRGERAEDVRWMRRAVELARLSEGYTRPNPPVGAVVVKRGQLIGEGRHAYAGAAHAEVAALDACSESPRDATIYVTLEPCSTHGRTPPCTERIIKEQLKRVVIGCEDRFAQHCGAGHRILEEHNIEVLSGLCADETAELVAPFFKYIKTGLPYLTLKLGMTLDGCIADRNANSQWITGEESRAEVQRMRRRADAVMVGSRTVTADDPSLLCRDYDAHNLMRVVIDSQGAVPATSRVLTDAAAERTIMFTSVKTPRAVVDAWRAEGSTVKALLPAVNGRLAVQDVMQELAAMNLMHVVCEGGGGLAGALHAAKLIDEYVLFYAPAVLGDQSATRGFAGTDAAPLKAMDRLKIRDVREFGDDICVRLHQRKPQ